MSTMKSLTEEEALKYVLDLLHRHSIKDSYPLLQFNFPDYEPSVLFRTLVLQQCWVDICNNNLSDAITHTQELGESPSQIFYQMWRQTTRNKPRQILYDYLRKQSLLSEKDEENYSILQKLINYINQQQQQPQPKKQKSFLSFISKSKTDSTQNADVNTKERDNIMNAFCETLKKLTENDTEHKFKLNESITNGFNENKSMIFPDLFEKLLPNEPTSNIFIGSIKFIESQPSKLLKYIKTNEGSVVERLWILHCEQKIAEMQQIFTEDISNFKANNHDSNLKSKKLFQFQHQNQNQGVKKQKKLKCLKFCNLYYNQLNEYEKESLFDILAVNGYFVNSELNKIEMLLYRICKNKLLFDQNWWNKMANLNFELFFKNFSAFCSENNLYLPFEMFVINNPKAKEIDLSNDNSLESHPLLKFIWDLWVKRDPFSGSISNIQYNFDLKTNVTDFEELWNKLPEDSIVPLSFFIWNKDTRRFLPNSTESISLSERLKKKYPLLASLVRGETPHPESTVKKPEGEDKKWRFSLFTSKYDLELHDTIESHFTQYNFNKIFTNYYGEDNFSGQPPFPHFDHPELINSPSDPLYIYYVKSLLPVSAFQQAVTDNASNEQFEDLCLKCMKEALINKAVRLSALTFIELTDFKLGTDFAVDFKLSITIFDRLNQLYESSPVDLNSVLSVDTPDPFSIVKTKLSNFTGNENANNSGALNELIISNLSKVFQSKSQEAAKFLQQKLHPTNVDVLLLSLLLGIRCNLPPDYAVIDILASKMHPAELILFIDRAEEIGCKYDMKKVASIIREKMPNSSLKEPILFSLTQELPSIYNNKEEQENSNTNNELEMEPALVIFNALKRSKNDNDNEEPYISLLQEAIMRHDSFYSIIANSVDGADASMCAIVTLMTMTEAFSFDVSHPPDEETRSRLFLEVINTLLLDGKSDEVLKSIEIFSKESIILPIVDFYDSVYLFAFKRAQLSIDRLYKLIKKTNIDDDLLGKIAVEDILNTLFPLQEGLAKHCANKSQIHLFRYLQLLKGIIDSDSSFVSPFLVPRVKLVEVINEFDNFRKTLLNCNLIGDKKKLVSDLLRYHSLSLGEAAAKCLDLQFSQFVKEWIDEQFYNALTPEEVIKAYFKVTKFLKNPDSLIDDINDINDYINEEEEENDVNIYIDPVFFVSLFAAMIQYVLPSSISYILDFAYKMICKENNKEKESFLMNMKSLILYLRLLKEHSIDSAILVDNKSNQESSSNESISKILQILFPQKENDDEYNSYVKSIPTDVPFNFTTPVTFSVDSISNLISLSINNAIEICLEEEGIEKAKMLSEWQNRKSQTIFLIETIQILFDFFNSKSSHVVHIIDDDEDENDSVKPPYCFTSKQKEFLITNGIKSSKFKEKTIDYFFLDSVEPKEIQDVLDSMSSKESIRIFKIISLQFKGSIILRSYSESDPEYKSKSSPLIRPSLLFGKSATERSFEFLKSPLPMMMNHIDLTRNIIETESIQSNEVASILSDNFIKMIIHQKESTNNNISFVIVDDYKEKYLEFASLCRDSTLLGDNLLLFANNVLIKKMDNVNNIRIKAGQKKIPILANIILHASLCTSKIEECSKLLDYLYDQFLSDSTDDQKNKLIYNQIIKIVTIFPEPSLLPKFIKFVLKMNEEEIDSIQQQGITITQKLCIEILNEARQNKTNHFQPEKFFNITLSCKLYHEHAKLQAESANNILSQIITNKEEYETIDSEIESESDSLSLSESGSSVDLITSPQTKKQELKKQKKIEKQKQKEEKQKLKRKNSKLGNKMESILQESSRRFLLALAYSLHEKSYHLSMECLKKLSLISLQRELSNTNSNLNVFGLNENEVLLLMKTKEFPFALTIAISYDMDNEINWADSIFTQSIENQGDDFLAAFLYFKPMTSNLCNAVVDKYNEYFEQKERKDVGKDKDVKERMKAFLSKIPNLVERYRLCKKLNFKILAENMREKHPLICEWCDKVF